MCLASESAEVPNEEVTKVDDIGFVEDASSVPSRIPAEFSKYPEIAFANPSSACTTKLPKSRERFALTDVPAESSNSETTNDREMSDHTGEFPVPIPIEDRPEETPPVLPRFA